MLTLPFNLRFNRTDRHALVKLCILTTVTQPNLLVISLLVLSTTMSFDFLAEQESKYEEVGTLKPHHMNTKSLADLAKYYRRKAI